VSETNPNLYKTTCLRFKPEDMEAGMKLFEERNVAMERQTECTNLMFAAIRRGDQAAAAEHRNALEAAQLEEQRLSEAMRPMQFIAWEEASPNLITNVGRNDMNDKYWRGSGYTQTVVMGLKGVGAPAAADTQAAHSGWLEVGGTNAPVYTGGRKAVTMGASASQVSVSPQQTFAITSAGTVAGMFMNNGGAATKDDTTGVLVNATDFTGGNQVVANGDSLLVTYTFNG
jgi:hypothetical protein